MKQSKETWGLYANVFLMRFCLWLVYYRFSILYLVGDQTPTPWVVTRTIW